MTVERTEYFFLFLTRPPLYKGHYFDKLDLMGLKRIRIGRWLKKYKLNSGTKQYKKEQSISNKTVI
jgi:hypothetical protein